MQYSHLQDKLYYIQCKNGSENHSTKYNVKTGYTQVIQTAQIIQTLVNTNSR